MLGALHSEGRLKPFLICEQCGRPILNAALGMAVFSGVMEEGQFSRVAFLHKGACDAAYRSRFGDKAGWSELSHFLLRLCLNTGLTEEQFASAKREVSLLEKFGPQASRTG